MFTFYILLDIIQKRFMSIIILRFVKVPENFPKEKKKKIYKKKKNF